MVNVLKHGFVSAVPDGPDANLVRPSNWNAEHVFAGGSNGRKLVWNTAESDNVVWLEDVINVAAPPYNADITGGVSAVAAIQQAIDDAQTSLTNRNKVVYCPDGVYLLDGEITFKEHNGFTRYPITLKGSRGNREGSGTVFRAAAGFPDAAMFRAIDNAGGSLNAYYNFEDFRVDGNSVAGLNAFDFPTLSYSEFNNIAFTDVLGTCISIGQCEVLVFDQCIFVSCGNGIDFINDTTHNALRFLNCSFNSLTGWAITVNKATGIAVNGCTIQACAIGGLYLSRVSSFYITHNHFEENGITTGHAYTTPATGTIKADIHLNGDDGGVKTTLDPDEACEVGVIKGNVFTSSSPTYHIFGNAITNTEIVNNLVSTTVQVFGSWGTLQYSFVKNVTLRDNDNIAVSSDIGNSETKQRLNLNAAFGNNNFNNPSSLHTLDFNIQPTNYLERYTMNMWSQIVTLSAGAFERIDAVDFVFRLSGVGPTHVFGVNIPVADIPGELFDQWCWFGLWGNLSTVTNNNLILYVNFSGVTGPGYSQQNNIGDVIGNRFRSFGFRMPTAGSGITAMQLGIQQYGSGGGVVDVFQPVLARVGAPYYRFNHKYIGPYYGTAAPTAGVWRQGDRVINTAPSGATPTDKWICTVAGTPGTWVALVAN